MSSSSSAPVVINKRFKRVKKELEDYNASRSVTDGVFTLEPYCDASTGSVDLTHFSATLLGPKGTPYAGGNFLIDIKIPQNYPFKAPMFELVNFRSMFHPNFAPGPSGKLQNGEYSSNICINVLKEDWTPAFSLTTVLLAISAILADPNPKDALNIEAASLLLRNKDEFEKRARKCMLEEN